MHKGGWLFPIIAGNSDTHRSLPRQSQERMRPVSSPNNPEFDKLIILSTRPEINTSQPTAPYTLLPTIISFFVSENSVLTQNNLL